MRALLLAVPALFFSAAQAADNDTLCATVYTYLSESARNNGVGSAGFDDAAARAQDMHLATNPGEDPSRYALSVIDGAQGIRNGVEQGLLSTDSVVSTATSCNSRYYTAQQDYMAQHGARPLAR